MTSLKVVSSTPHPYEKYGWKGDTRAELRELLRKQPEYEKWRKHAGFRADLMRPEIWAGITVFKVEREASVIIQKRIDAYNAKYPKPPLKQAKVKKLKPIPAAAPNLAAMTELIAGYELFSSIPADPTNVAAMTELIAANQLFLEAFMNSVNPKGN